MNKSGNTSLRRSADEWARLVEAWTESGLNSTDFGAKHGIQGHRLTWWKWHLGKSRRKRRVEPVKLIELDVVADRPPASQWELRTASGDTLRVTELLTLEELGAILRAMGLRGRAR